MPTHLLPKEILNWAKNDDMPDNLLDLFIECRVNITMDDLKIKLNRLTFKVTDTAQTTTTQPVDR